MTYEPEQDYQGKGDTPQEPEVIKRLKKRVLRGDEVDNRMLDNPILPNPIDDRWVDDGPIDDRWV
jgi:hypothetical protein